MAWIRRHNGNGHHSGGHDEIGPLQHSDMADLEKIVLSRLDKQDEQIDALSLRVIKMEDDRREAKGAVDQLVQAVENGHALMLDQLEELRGKLSDP